MRQTVIDHPVSISLFYSLWFTKIVLVSYCPSASLFSVPSPSPPKKIIQAVTFVGFLTGFVAVLCIGNYYRAKRAMERQRQRRLARLSGVGGNGVIMDSPAHSTATSHDSDEQNHLLGGGKGMMASRGGMMSKPSNQSWQASSRRRNFDDGGGGGGGTDTLLLDINDTQQRAPRITRL